VSAQVPSFNFRSMREDDLEWIVREERDLHPFPWTHGNFSDSLAAGQAGWVMEEGAVPAAYAVVLHVLDEAHLLNISVLRARQRQGFGARLLDWIERDARLRGATQFFLEVRPSNTAALCLYQNSGYLQIGRRKNYYPAACGREDALVMRKAL